MAACRAGDYAMLEAVPQASGKLANPLGAVAFANESWDSHHLMVDAASSIDSVMHGGDMAECYWLALTRDVPFDDYPADPLVLRAVADLRTVPGYGWVTPTTCSAVVSRAIRRGLTFRSSCCRTSPTAR